MAWIIATKLEMTRIVKGDNFVPVTLLKVENLRVVWFRTLENDWYSAIIIWILEKGNDEIALKEWKKTLAVNAFSTIKEFPLSAEEMTKYSVWDVVDLSIFENVTEVRIEWYSKWKGFAWAMKRHNFHGGPGSHGSKFHRALWSIGTRKPRRTHKWKKMHGHMWDAKVSLSKVSLELVNKDLGVIWVRWGVPGWRNSLVNIIF
jgi:large subunit ribosomal protein L3